MSMPQFPNDTLNLTRDDVINQILSSIAMEELGLSHILNAEGEKLQYILGTLEGSTPPQPPTVQEVLQVNESVQKLLETTSYQQMFLKNKMSDALSASTMQGPTGATGATGSTGADAPIITPTALKTIIPEDPTFTGMEVNYISYGNVFVVYGTGTIANGFTLLANEAHYLVTAAQFPELASYVGPTMSGIGGSWSTTIHIDATGIYIKSPNPISVPAGVSLPFTATLILA